MIGVALVLGGIVIGALVLVAIMQQRALRAIHRELDRREAAATAWITQVEMERLRRAKGLEDAIRSISRTARGDEPQP